MPFHRDDETKQLGLHGSEKGRLCGEEAWCNQRVIDINWRGIDTTYNDTNELQPRLPRLDEIMLSLLPLVVAGARLTGAIYWKAE